VIKWRAALKAEVVPAANRAIAVCHAALTTKSNSLAWTNKTGAGPGCYSGNSADPPRSIHHDHVDIR
jgi:hypothetical protein